MAHGRCPAAHEFPVPIDLDKDLVGGPVEFLEIGYHRCIGGVLDFPQPFPGIAGYLRDLVRHAIAAFETTEIIDMHIDPGGRDHDSGRLLDHDRSLGKHAGLGRGW